MSQSLIVKNRQRAQRLDVRLLRRCARVLLVELLERESFDLAVYLVAADRMTRLNEEFLQHAGSTDVITFDYADPGSNQPLHGELFLCVDEAKIQATRYRTTWQEELARYLVHGVLHLTGFDDATPALRRPMKREEDQLLKALATRFNLAKIAGPGSGRVLTRRRDKAL